MFRISYLYFLCSCLFGSCTIEDTKIITDFDNVKLTETSNPLSTYYCKGTVRGMPFSYSTNDVYYADSKFQSFSDTLTIKYPGLFFSVGNFGEYFPIFFYIESNNIWFRDFIKTSMKINTKFTLTPNSIPPFYIFFTALYHDPNYTSQLSRTFQCCKYGKDSGQIIISNVQSFNGYTNVTFQFTGPLYSNDTEGSILFFGDASIEMCIRINQ